MKVGTKSLLFGVHNIIWHPLTVYWAWKKLYGRPNWKEIICIIMHDWGYLGCRDMDGEEGNKHPEWAANKVYKWFGKDYFILCLYHSRHYAKNRNREPSKLCYADKLSIMYEPAWFYLLRARLSGELKLYRIEAKKFVSTRKSDKEWFEWVKDRLTKIGLEQNGGCVEYTH